MTAPIAQAKCHPEQANHRYGLCRGCSEKQTVPPHLHGKRGTYIRYGCRCAPCVGTLRAHHLKMEYGITPSEYATMLAQQGGVCAICRNEESALGNRGQVRPLSVDHDHTTGAVRALLCSRCNTAVGLLRDDSSLARELAHYLDR